MLLNIRVSNYFSHRFLYTLFLFIWKAFACTHTRELYWCKVAHPQLGEQSLAKFKKDWKKKSNLHAASFFILAYFLVYCTAAQLILHVILILNFNRCHSFLGPQFTLSIWESFEEPIDCAINLWIICNDGLNNTAIDDLVCLVVAHMVLDFYKICIRKIFLS